MVYLACEQAALTQNSQWNKHFTPPSPFPRQPISACLLCLYEKYFIFRTGLSNFELFLYTFHRIFSPHLFTKFVLCWPRIYRIYIIKLKDFLDFLVMNFIQHCFICRPSALLHLPPLGFHCVGGCWIKARATYLLICLSILLLYTPHLFSKSVLLCWLF
jgi:hypothetical protein